MPEVKHKEPCECTEREKIQAIYDAVVGDLSRAGYAERLRRVEVALARIGRASWAIVLLLLGNFIAWIRTG